MEISFGRQFLNDIKIPIDIESMIFNGVQSFFMLISPNVKHFKHPRVGLDHYKRIWRPLNNIEIFNVSLKLHSMVLFFIDFESI